MGFKMLSREAIDDGLEDTTRQYLTGRLTLPQRLAHIDDDEIEFGISSYKDPAWEDPHSHSRAKEFQYVLRGMTEYRDLDTDEVHRFLAGDFYVIYPGTRYIQRIGSRTQILFVKLPAGNDKICEKADAEAVAWARQELHA